MKESFRQSEVHQIQQITDSDFSYSTTEIVEEAEFLTGQQLSYEVHKCG